MGPNDGPEELHILGAITNRNTRIAIKAIMNWNVTYRFAARPRESSRLSSGCCRRGAKSSFSSFAFACSNSDSVSAPDDLKSARRCSSSDSDIFVVDRTLISTDDRRLGCGWSCCCGVYRSFGAMPSPLIFRGKLVTWIWRTTRNLFHDAVKCGQIRTFSP